MYSKQQRYQDVAHNCTAIGLVPDIWYSIKWETLVFLIVSEVPGRTSYHRIRIGKNSVPVSDQNAFYLAWGGGVGLLSPGPVLPGTKKGE